MNLEENAREIEADNDSGDALSIYSDSEEVNAMDRRFNKDRRPKDERRQPDRRAPETSNPPIAMAGLDAPREATGLCWNCGKPGHMWRYCREEKRLFCYVCGTPGKTSVTCPNHPRANQQNVSGN
ncbi:uncharacterized protein LOC134206560 [Armigeres subalbatus]|uniref:uncharacterized protein LOC134206560 n=1 Tax=Armigeres subalbatus TaxID=124917 RepID=UPI002ED1338F